ncbi:MAG: TrkA family potassium uptake protein [Coriobacteriia bacterium]|nr:TrkA family potassium uptake protein [Coriobacteriia bacterium]
MKILANSGHAVTVVDSNPEVIDHIDPDFSGHTVVGTGFDERVLVQAGIRECDAFAAVTSSDNVNLMASEVARRLYNVPHVITRLVNPSRLDVYHQLGLDFVCDTELVAEEISAKIRSRRSNHIDTLGEYEVMTFSLEAPAVMQVRDLEELGEIDVILYSHNGAVSKATPTTYLHPGDAVMAVVHEGSLAALDPYMRG